MKKLVNKYLRKFAGAEIHGIGYLQKLKNGGFEKDPFEAQKTFFSNRGVDNILDVGGHHGGVSLKYHKLFPQATVYAFEPFPSSQAKFIQNTEGIAQIELFPYAISDSHSTQQFFVNKNEDTSSLLKSTKTANPHLNSLTETKATIEVEAYTLDQFAEEQHVSEIDILKMDIQGAELKALNGAKGLLEKGKINLIYTEIAFQPHYEGQCLYYELAGFLAEYGFTLVDFFQTYYLNERLGWGDAIFVKDQ